jgi:hypothetical protein
MSRRQADWASLTLRRYSLTEPAAIRHGLGPESRDASVVGYTRLRPRDAARGNAGILSPGPQL